MTRPAHAVPTADDIVAALDAATTPERRVAAIRAIRPAEYTDEERVAISRAICRATGRSMQR
jgi:hypothetical protein